MTGEQRSPADIHLIVELNNHMTKEQQEDIAVMQEYPFIVKWGRELQSYDYYIINQCYEAKADNATKNAIYKNQNGTWNTTDDISNKELRKRWNLS